MRASVDLKRMRYLVEVARSETITMAAQTLSITQPALTRSIAEMEAELGVKLFHRLPRGVQPTEVGERFIDRAKQILGEVDDLVAGIRAGQDLLTGRLKLGIAPTGYAGYARGALRELATEHPEVAIEVVGGSPQALCPKLLHGELHVILGSSSYLRRWRELEVVPLRRMYFACMLRRTHPLARQAKISEVEVLSCPAIFPQSVEPVYSDIAQRHAHHALPPLQPRYVTDDFELAKLLVNSTDAYYPVTSLERAFGELGSEFLMVKDTVKIPEHQLSIAFSTNRPKRALAERFEQLLMKYLAG